MKLAKATVLAGIAVFVVALVAGITPAGAVEPAFHFFRCEAVAPGTGEYQFGCFRKAMPLSDWERVYIGSTPETIKTASSSAFELETTISEQTLLISCSTEAGTGTGKNPEPFKSTNGEGEATLTFESCAVSKPGGCTVPSKKITTSKLHEAVEESKTLGLGINFSPASGTTFATVVLNEGCALGKEVTVKGSDFGVVNEKAELEFTNASSSLTVGTKEAKLRGKLKQANEKGTLVSVG